MEHIGTMLMLKICTFCRGRRIVFWWPDTKTNIIRYSNISINGHFPQFFPAWKWQRKCLPLRNHLTASFAVLMSQHGQFNVSKLLVELQKFPKLCSIFMLQIYSWQLERTLDWMFSYFPVNLSEGKMSKKSTRCDHFDQSSDPCFSSKSFLLVFP